MWRKKRLLRLLPLSKYLTWIVDQPAEIAMWRRNGMEYSTAKPLKGTLSKQDQHKRLNAGTEPELMRVSLEILLLTNRARLHKFC